MGDMAWVPLGPSGHPPWRWGHATPSPGVVTTPGCQQDPLPPSMGLGTRKTPSLSPRGMWQHPGAGLGTPGPPACPQVGVTTPSHYQDPVPTLHGTGDTQDPDFVPRGGDSTQSPAGPCAHPPWGWGPPGGLLQVRGAHPGVWHTPEGVRAVPCVPCPPPVPRTGPRACCRSPGRKIPLIP